MVILLFLGMSISVLNGLPCTETLSLFNLTGKVFEDEKPVEGALVIVMSEGDTIMVAITGKNGKYDLGLDLNREYLVSYTKKGYCVKTLYVSTKNIPPDRLTSIKTSHPIDITIFKLPSDPVKAEKVNSVLKEPIGKYYYHPDRQDFDYDAEYMKIVKGKLAELMKEIKN